MYSFALGEGPATGFCKHDNVISRSMKWGISSVDEQILAAGKERTPWSYQKGREESHLLHSD